MATKKKKRRHFTPEYKSEVVQLVETGGKSVGQVARDLDLTETSGAGVGSPSGNRRRQGTSRRVDHGRSEEFAALKREVKTLRMERDILKKATAFFAKETT